MTSDNSKHFTGKDINNIWGIGAIAIAFSLAVFFYGGVSSYFLLLASLILLLMFVYHLVGIVDGKPFFWSKVHTLVLFYIVYMISNIFTSVFPENSIHMVWLFSAMPMVLLLSGKLCEKKWSRLLLFISIACVFSALWGISEFIFTGERGNGPVIDPNSWASVFNIFYFLLLSHYLTSTHRYSSLVLIVLLIISTAIFSAYSRVGNLNFMAALVLVSFVALFSRQLRLKLGLVLLSVVLSFTFIHSVNNADEVTHDEGYTLDVESIGWSQRLSQWQAGLAQSRDYPILGSGFGTFKLLYPAYRSVGDLNTAGNYLHNDYIQLLAEAGPILLLFLIGFVVFLLYKLWRSLSAFFVGRQNKHLEAIVLIVAIGTVCVHALMNFTFYNMPNQMLIGCGLARLLTIFDEGYARNIKVESPGLVKFGVFMLASYMILANSLDFVSADLVYKGGIIPINRGEPGGELALYDTVSTIRKLRPGVSANRFAMATFYRRSFDQLEPSNIDARRSLSIVAALEYQAGLEINPYHYQVRQFFADFLKQNPQLMEIPEIYQTPESLLTEGLAIGPCYIEHYLKLAELLEATGRSDEAYSLLLNNALPWAGLRYDGYQDFQIVMFRKILQQAKAKQDLPALRQLLNAMTP